MARRRKVERETPEFISMVRRMIRALGKRVGEADDVDLAQMVELRAALETAIEAAVAQQRANGASWSMIGQGLGTTKQYAQRRYGSERESLVS